MKLHSAKYLSAIQVSRTTVLLKLNSLILTVNPLCSDLIITRWYTSLSEEKMSPLNNKRPSSYNIRDSGFLKLPYCYQNMFFLLTIPPSESTVSNYIVKLIWIVGSSFRYSSLANIAGVIRNTMASTLFVWFFLCVWLWLFSFGFFFSKHSRKLDLNYLADPLFFPCLAVNWIILDQIDFWLVDEGKEEVVMLICGWRIW